MLPAFPHIRATRALAYGVELERAHDSLQFLVIRSAEVLHPQPRRPRMGRGRRRAIVGQYGERGSHLLEFESYSTRHVPLKQPPLRFKDFWPSIHRRLRCSLASHPCYVYQDIRYTSRGRTLGFVRRCPADIGDPAPIDSTLYQIVHIARNAFVVCLQHGKTFPLETTVT